MPSPSAMAERNPGVPVSSIDASTVATPCFSFSAYVISLCQKAFHAQKRSSVVQHQDGVEETKIFEKILHIPLQDMKTVYRGTLFLRHSINLKLPPDPMPIALLLTAFVPIFALV